MYRDYVNSPIYWLRRAYLGVRKAVDAEFGPCGLTGAQFEVLHQLWRQDGLSQRELEERLAIRSATLTRLVDGLCARGLVVRRPNPTDGRMRDVFLTPRGQALREEAARTIARVQERLLAGFTPDEAAQLEDVLRRMAENMGDHGEGCL